MRADLVHRRRGSPLVSRKHTDQRCVRDRGLSWGGRGPGGVRRLEWGVRRYRGVDEVEAVSLTTTPSKVTDRGLTSPAVSTVTRRSLHRARTLIRRFATRAPVPTWPASTSSALGREAAVNPQSRYTGCFVTLNAVPCG